MPGTKIIGDQSLEALSVGFVVGQLFPSLCGLVHCKGNRLANKRGTRIEMVIEATMCQARELHQVDNAEPFGAFFAQTVRGIFNDPIVGLTPMVSHCHSAHGTKVIGCTSRAHPIEAILEPRFLADHGKISAVLATLYDICHVTTRKKGEFAMAAAASEPFVIRFTAHTALGRFEGELSPLSSHKLGST